MDHKDLAATAPIKDAELAVRDLLAEHLHVQQELLRDNAHFLNDLGVDWLDLLEVVGQIEAALQIEFSDTEIDDLQNVGDLIRFAKAHQGR